MIQEILMGYNDNLHSADSSYRVSQIGDHQSLRVMFQGCKKYCQVLGYAGFFSFKINKYAGRGIVTTHPL